MKCILSDTQRSEREIPHWIKPCSRDLNPARNPQLLARPQSCQEPAQIPGPMHAGAEAFASCRVLLSAVPTNSKTDLASLGVHTLRPGKTLPIPFGKTQARCRAGHFGLQTREDQVWIKSVRLKKKLVFLVKIWHYTYQKAHKR